MSYNKPSNLITCKQHTMRKLKKYTFQDVAYPSSIRGNQTQNKGYNIRFLFLTHNINKMFDILIQVQPLTLVCYSLTSLVATDATSDCFVRPAASQVFLPIWIAEDKPRDSQDSRSFPPRGWWSTDEIKPEHRAVALLWHWEKSYFETS